MIQLERGVSVVSRPQSIEPKARKKKTLAGRPKPCFTGTGLLQFYRAPAPRKRWPPSRKKLFPPSEFIAWTEGSTEEPAASG